MWFVVRCFTVEFIVSCCDLYIRALYRPARLVLSSSPLLSCSDLFLSGGRPLSSSAPLRSSPISGILSSILDSIFINLFVGCIFFIKTSGILSSFLHYCTVFAFVLYFVFSYTNKSNSVVGIAAWFSQVTDTRITSQ